ncbi:unannotated protein [freshwater metagenome]|uniref:Unannotated protein n=1 Tax=freshwater metagenome TaxID=449393 RepID=A0A6J6X5F6_9ZZZZ
MHVIIDHGRQLVVGGRYRVNITGEVQIQRFERHRLAIAPARGATLDAKGRTHGRLANGRGRPLTNMRERLSESQRGRGLALTERSRGDGRHHDILRARTFRQGLDGLQLDLGNVATVGLEKVLGNTHLGRQLGDGPQRGSASNL